MGPTITWWWISQWCLWTLGYPNSIVLTYELGYVMANVWNPWWVPPSLGRGSHKACVRGFANSFVSFVFLTLFFLFIGILTFLLLDFWSS